MFKRIILEDYNSNLLQEIEKYINTSEHKAKQHFPSFVNCVNDIINMRNEGEVIFACKKITSIDKMYSEFLKLFYAEFPETSNDLDYYHSIKKNDITSFIRSRSKSILSGMMYDIISSGFEIPSIEPFERYYEIETELQEILPKLEKFDNVDSLNNIIIKIIKDFLLNCEVSSNIITLYTHISNNLSYLNINNFDYHNNRRQLLLLFEKMLIEKII
jgi:hypothetical protein